MRKINLIAVAVLSSGLMAGAAHAETFASNMGGCNHAASAVRDAIAANAQSANLADAQKEQGLGRDFCGNQFYERGVQHYQKALSLLSGKS